MDNATYERNEPFPVEWTEWRAVWEAWSADQREDGLLGASSYRFPEPNFLADEVIGVFTLRSAGREGPVELSEVTFPDLSGGKRPRQTLRYVGVTFGEGAGHVDGGLAASFAELEAILGIAELV